MWFGDANFGLFLYEDGQVRDLSPTLPLAGFDVLALEPQRGGVMRVTISRKGSAGTQPRVFDCDGKTSKPVQAKPATARPGGK